MADTDHTVDIAADKGSIQDTAGNIVGIAVAAAGTTAQGLEPVSQLVDSLLHWLGFVPD